MASVNLILLLMFIVRSASANITTTTTTTTVNTISTIITDEWRYDDECTNECDKNNNRYWCGKYRADPGGFISRCVQYTYRGRICVNECGVQTYSKSTACRTNFYKSRRYCNVHKDNCDEHGNDCDKTVVCDDDWEYCSVDDMHTRYGVMCKERCAKAGESYYWCYTVDGSWDYCSPKTREGVHVSLEIEVTRYNKKCSDVCGRAGYSYFWCEAIGVPGGWDYCSPENRTIYNEQCTDPCSRRGEKYHWCRTSTSWDYCSPRTDENFAYSSINAQGDADIFVNPYISIIVFVCLSAIFVVCLLLKRNQMPPFNN